MNALPYPDQDPRDIRAKATRDKFDAVRRSLQNYANVWSQYTSDAIQGRGDYGHVIAARQILDRRIESAQAAVLDALEEADVPAIHEVKP